MTLAVVLGVVILTLSFIAYMFGFEHGRGTRIRQVAAIRDNVMRIVCDPRTHPHTRLQLEELVLPRTTERE